MPTTDQQHALAIAAEDARDPELFLDLFGEALDATGDWAQSITLAADYAGAFEQPVTADSEEGQLARVYDTLASHEHGERDHQPEEGRDQDAWWGASPDVVVNEGENPVPVTRIDFYHDTRRQIREQLS